MRKVTIVAVVLLARAVFAACPVDRALVKTVTDAHALNVALIPMPSTIAALHARPMAARPLPQDGRLAPEETTIHSIIATLIAYRLTPRGEIHLVLSDEERRTITATIPSLQCAAGSRLIGSITRARADFETRYRPAEEFTEVRRAIAVEGVGLWDFLQGQRGLGPNGLSLYPVTMVNFAPFPRPTPPPPAARRRSVGSGGTARCSRPSLTITASRGSACTGEQVTIDWRSSDSAARVDIGGLGTALPASGSRVVTVASSTVYSGRAMNACGSSDEALAVVTRTSAATASLSGPSTLIKGNSGTLSIFASAISSWQLRSSLGNSISPSSGTTNGTATYSANKTGTDTVTLTTAGGACSNVTKTHTILISDQPTTGGLKCCDGTRSPSCFSCSNKSGCCSGHGGVCDCK